MSGNVVYAFACVVVPAVWAVAMAMAFDRLEKRSRRSQSGDRPPPIDYSI